MQIEQLELLVAVVDHGGMTAAADSLGMSQPAVSRSIRTLERQLGVALFRREGRGIVPTPAGQLAYERSRDFTSGWRATMAELRLLAGRPDDVTVAVPFGTARVLIPVIVRRAATDLADIHVRVIESASPDSVDALVSRSIDAAVVYPATSSVTNDGSANLRVLATEHLYAIGRPALVGDDDQPIGLGDLAPLPLLLTGPSWGIRGLVDDAFESIDATPHVVREVGIAEALLSFALEGDGVAILPYSNVARDHDLGLLSVRQIEQPAINRPIAIGISDDLPIAVANELNDLLTASVTEVAESARWTLSLEKLSSEKLSSAKLSSG